MSRIARWLLFAAVFSALGAAVFDYVRSQPRAVIVACDSVRLLSHDGSRLLTSHTHPVRGGALRVWDTHSGALLYEWVHVVDSPNNASTKDNRFFADLLEDGTVRLFDWQQGQHWLFTVSNIKGVELAFSPQGRWLIVPPSTLIDVTTRQVRTLQVDGSEFAGDDRLLLREGNPEKTITVWDIEGQKKNGAIKPHESASWELSPDRRLLVAASWEDTDEGAETREVWDISTCRRRFSHRVPKDHRVWNTAFTPDSRCMALWSVVKKINSTIEMIDLESGAVLWSQTTRFVRGHPSLSFAPDGASLCLKGHPDLQMIDTESGEVLWKTANWNEVYFEQRLNVVLHQDVPDDFAWFVDARTGQRIRRPPIFFNTEFSLTPTPDGRHFVIHGWRMRGAKLWSCQTWLDKIQHKPAQHQPDEIGTVVVMQAATHRELFRHEQTDPLWGTLSDDGSTFVTAESLTDDAQGPQRMRIWDVHPTKAWWWALGVSFGAALVWQFAMLPGWRALRPKSSVKPKAQNVSNVN